MIIGEKIKKLRLQKGLSQEDIAYKISVSQSAYAKIENGNTKLDVKRLLSIADILEIDPAELLPISDEKVINFSNNKITNAYIENFYAEQKEQYEKRISHLEGEIVFLRNQLESFIK